MKTVCFVLGHPAHFHLYKNVINNLTDRNVDVRIYIGTKDILSDLLDASGLGYIVITGNSRRSNLYSKFVKLVKSSITYYKLMAELRPDLIVGCLSQLVYAGRLLRIPTIFNAEDDINYTLFQGLITYPFVKHILTPGPTRTGVFSYKQIRYDGYHKLAYLHPASF